MLICLALMLNAGLAYLPALAAEVEAEARALTMHDDVTPVLIADLDEFSDDAERLSGALRKAGVEQDLPQIFDGIAADARARSAALQHADTAAERAEALADLHILLDDTLLIAPFAAAAAADASTLAAR